MSDLIAMKKVQSALAKARRRMKDDPDKALAEHRKNLLRQRGGLTERELAELKEFIASLRRDLKKMNGEQQELFDATGKVPEKLLAELENQQARLERRIDPKLDEAQ